jgi:hypothetical protein
MKKSTFKYYNLILLLSLLFINCGKDGLGSLFNIQNCDEVCSEWERCTNISEDWSYNWQCRPKLWLYTNYGYWSGQIHTVDNIGNTYTEDIVNLKARGPNHLNPDSWKLIKLPYPLSSHAYQNSNNMYPDEELNHLEMEFTNPISLEFNINDSIYDPFVESVVFYQGTGQIKTPNGSANAILEFNCYFIFDEQTYSVSFSATR